MKQGFALKAGLSLAMTPALQQAIRMLQLSTLDLRQEIQEALDSNVMLELEEGEAASEVPATGERETVAAAERDGRDLEREVGSDADIPEHMPVDADWSEVFDDGLGVGSSQRDSDAEELADYRQQNSTQNETLREHLLWQARLAPLSEWESEVAEYLIDAVDEDGYLSDWDEACTHFKEVFGVTPRQLERVLQVVQDFDPPGVAARDLAECLGNQLRQMPADTASRALAMAIVAQHLPLVARGDIAGLKRVTQAEESSLRIALALIKRLQPHPGRPYAAHEANYVEPDLFVSKREGRWWVSINREAVPPVRINAEYLAMVKRADSSRDQTTLRNHLQEARYFLHSLQARNDTLMRVAQCIVEEQRAFLEYGPEAMRPMVLRDVSERLGMHESTVSRATANKYMLTPRGLFELKHFFSSHVQTASGGTASATAIQAMIKRLITAESAASPLSDASLAELLQKEGIQVARRTIAKYREAMNIPPSHERRPN